MPAQRNGQTAISIPSALQLVGIIAGAWAMIVVGAATIAVPFSVSPSIHKLGIPLYFLEVVVLQTLIGTREWQAVKSNFHLPNSSLFENLWSIC